MGTKREPIRSIKERDELVEKWIHLPKWFLGKYRNHPVLSHLDLDDALQNAYVALIRAASFWDKSKGKNFSSYAVIAMYRENQMSTTHQRGSIHVPYYAWTAKAKKDHRKAAERSYCCVPLKKDPLDKSTLPQQPDVYDEYYPKLEAALTKLSDQQRETINLYYFKRLTLREIALAHGISFQRFSLVRIQAIRKLRSLMTTS